MPAEHDPITLAKTIATLDHLSGGRVVLGAGFGWNTDELTDHGVPAGKRRTVVREYLEAMQALWSEEEASYHGDYVSFGASWAWPKPMQQPRIPVIIGAGGTPKTFAWIARSADGWLTTPGEADLDAKIAQLHQAWREAGRAGLPQVRALAGKPEPDLLAHWAEIGVTDVAFGMPDRAAGRGRRLPKPPGREARPRRGRGRLICPPSPRLRNPFVMGPAKDSVYRQGEKRMKVNPVEAGLDERQLERITEHLQHRYVDAGRIAGCQVAVARHGQVGYFRSLGFRDLGRSLPVEEDTIWRIYSMTKPITGVALMSLYERGMFQLSDPVTRFIPQWRDLKVRQRAEDGSEQLVDPQRPMTVRDLMMHMSGLGFAGGRTLQELFSADNTSRAEGFTPGSRRGPDATLQTMVEHYAGYPLEFHPGTHWLYSVSTDMCGRLVEIISGQRFDDYLRQTIFEPLGMNDTGFVVPDEKVDRFAACYRRDASKNLVLVDDPQRQRLPEGAHVPVRRRRAGLHDSRLPAFLPDAARRGRAGSASASWGARQSS